MSTLEAKPKKVRILNPKMMSIAALVLVVLALLFLAAPLIRQASSPQRTGIFIPSGTGANGTSAPVVGQVTNSNGPSSGSSGGNQFFIGGGGAQVQNGTGGTGTRRITVGASSRVGILLYFVMLLISLAAALGMLFTKNWGRVLAIIMGVLYALLGLVTLLPLLFIRFVGAPNPVNILLGIVHVLLAVSVIVLASIPGKTGAASGARPTSAST